jgi:hypothetical protein
VCACARVQVHLEEKMHRTWLRNPRASMRIHWLERLKARGSQQKPPSSSSSFVFIIGFTEGTRDSYAIDPRLEEGAPRHRCTRSLMLRVSVKSRSLVRGKRAASRVFIKESRHGWPSGIPRFVISTAVRLIASFPRRSD